MPQQKGFSLIEVLVSLLLVSTLALTLVQQQWQNRQLLNQLVVRAQNSAFHDQQEQVLFLSDVTEVKPKCSLVPRCVTQATAE